MASDAYVAIHLKEGILRRPCNTVLPGVFRGQRHRCEAIDSVLAYDFGSFEHLIVDGGSTDSTEELLEPYRDRRIRLVDCESNIGITRSSNRVLKMPRRRFIARMDADYCCDPYRLSREVRFLDQHFGRGVCGFGFSVVDTNGANGRSKIKDSYDIRLCWIGQSGSPIDHRAAMPAEDATRKHGLFYSKVYLTAEDCDD